MNEIEINEVLHIISTFKEKYFKTYNYLPTTIELYKLYTDGELNLTDEEENSLLQWYEYNHLNNNNNNNTNN
jgi:hypothetical protein